MVHFSYYTWNKIPFHCVKGPWETSLRMASLIQTLRETICWLNDCFLASDASKVKSTATHHSRRKQPAMLPPILHSKLWLLPPQALTALTQPLTPSTPSFDSSHSSQPTLGFLVEWNVFLISICHWISLRWIYLIPSKAMKDSQAPKLHGLCTVCEPVSTKDLCSAFMFSSQIY